MSGAGEVGRLGGEEVVQTPFGKFLVHPQDLIGSTLKAGTLWDGAGFLIPLVHEHGSFGNSCACGVPSCPAVKPNTIIDIGANIGAFSVWLARQGAWRVIAVEPVSDTFRLLKANMDLNRDVCDARVIPIPVAAYDRPVKMALAPEEEQGQSLHEGNFSKIGNIGGLALKVDSRGDIIGTPLDDYQHCFGLKVSLIKCDAQGCDLRALKGLRKTIARDAPFIIFEWEPELAALHGDKWADVENFMHSIAYEWRPWPTHPGNFVAWSKRGM